MSLSAICNINGNPIPVAVNGVTGLNVASGSTITVSLANPTGVNNWTINCTATDGFNPLSTVPLVQATKIQNNYICTFIMPLMDGYVGAALQFTSVVNNDPKTTVTFGVFILNLDGSRLFFPNENLETNVVSGVVYDLNFLVNKIVANNGSTIGQLTVGIVGSGADFLTSGTADQTVINTALIQLSSLGGGVLIVLPGNYNFSGSIIVPSNCSLEGVNVGAVIFKYSTGFTGNLITAVGTLVGSSFNLSADLVDGYNQISVTPTSDYAAVADGDILYLISDDFWEPPGQGTDQSGRMRGEWVKVNTKSTNSFTIYGMSRDVYTVANNARLQRVSFVEDVTIKNVQIKNTATPHTLPNGGVGILASFCRNLRIENCKVFNLDWTAYQIKDCYVFDVSNNRGYNLTDDTVNNYFGYGLVLGGCLDFGTVDSNYFDRIRHGITTSTGNANHGIPMGVVVSNNVVEHATNSGIDTHQCGKGFQIIGNHIRACQSWGIFNRGRSTIIDSNNIFDCGAGISCGISLQSQGGMGSGTVITNNKIKHIGHNTYTDVDGTFTSLGYGILITNSDNGICSNNQISDCWFFGINPATSVNNWLFSHNTITNCNVGNGNTAAIAFGGGTTGTTASITTLVGSTANISCPGKTFTTQTNIWAGQNITISGASSSANNGTFLITAVVDNTNIQYTNPSAVAGDVNNGSISYGLSQSTNNTIEFNIVRNIPASVSDRDDAIAGQMKFFISDSGPTSIIGNTGNIIRYNDVQGMITGFYNGQNIYNTYAEKTNNQYFKSRSNIGNYDLQLIGAFTNDAVVIGDGVNGAATNIQSSTGNVNLLQGGSTGMSINARTSGTNTIGCIAGTSLKLDISTSSVNADTAGVITIAGQIMTGTTTVGGGITFNTGTGTTSSGPLLLEIGGNTIGQFTQDANDFISFGAIPATGNPGIRLPNNVTGVTFRNATNNANVAGLSINSSNGITLGAASNNGQNIQLAHAAGAQINILENGSTGLSLLARVSGTSSINNVATSTAFTIQHNNAPALTAGGLFTIRSQGVVSDGYASGGLALQTGVITTGTAGSITLAPGTTTVITVAAAAITFAKPTYYPPVTAPGNPASGWVIYTDTGDGNKLKAKASTGTTVTLGTP